MSVIHYCRGLLRRQTTGAVVCVGICCAISATISAQESADLILHNATVYTVDAEKSVAEAVAIKGDRIVAVGGNDEILGLRDDATRLIDLHGQLVLPGFNDSHVHFSSAAEFLEFNIMAAQEQQSFVDRVTALCESLPKGEWITGGLWGAYDEWALGSAGNSSRQPFTPDMQLVADISREHPIFIQKFDGSEFAANDAAMRLAGLDPQSSELPDGVEFVRDAQGNWNGLLRGRAVPQLFRAAIPRQTSLERRIKQTRHAMQIASRYGVTSVSDMSDDTQLQICRQLYEAGQLHLRVHFRYGLERWRELADRGIAVGSGDEWIRLGGLKGHIDGIMGTSSARFFEPYENDPTNRGRWRPLMVDDQGSFVEGKFLEYMLDADAAGLQLTVHAIGDEANQLLLDYLQQVIEQNGKRDRRFRLVHAQVLADDDFARLGPLGVIAEVQPFHLSDDMRWMELRIGDRCANAYAFKRIVEHGALLCFGSDWPGTSAAEYPVNPLLALYAATTRQTVTGLPDGGWFPDERIDMATAIAAHTYNPAYASFEESIKGSIEVGKLADLVVLDHNLLTCKPEEILRTEVVYTIVGGQVAYSRE